VPRAVKDPKTGLTIKQENFCLAYIETGNASESYRRAYNVRPGTTENTINQSAKRLIDDPQICLRINDLRAPVIEKVQITLEKHLGDLQRLRDKAEAAEKFGPAIQAEIARGKSSGLYEDTVNLNHGVQESLAALTTALADRAKLVPTGAIKPRAKP
jgi:phage terminase small subunit